MIITNNRKLSNNSKPKSKHINIFVTFFVLIQIHLSADAAPKGLRWSKEFVVFSSFLFIAVIFLYYIFYKKYSINKKSLIFTICIICISLLSVIVNQDFTPDNFIFLSIVLSGFFVCNIFDRDDYIEGYLNAIAIYSIYSLVSTYLLLPFIMRGFFAFFPTKINILGTPFVDMGLSFAVKWNGLMRNQGIFREPGVFQFFVLVAIAIEMFYVKYRPINKKYILVFIITLISTFSTAGILCFIPMLYLFFVRNIKKNRLTIVLIITIVAFFIYISIDANSSFVLSLNRSFNKIRYIKNNNSSVVRVESIFNLLKMSMNSPIIGSSFTNGFKYIIDNYIKYNTSDITGTMISFIMALGFPMGLFINYNFYKFCIILNNNMSISLILFLSLFISLNSQNLVYSSILWTFIFFPYMDSTEKIEVC